MVWYEGSGTSDRRWLHSDERGSVVAVTDGSGAVPGVNSYDPYGKPATGNIGRFGYTGQAWLPELGMWYYKARIYNPANTVARFMQSDPIGYGGGMNLYAYVSGDPVNLTDPLGLSEGDTNNGPSRVDIVVTAPQFSSADLSILATTGLFNSSSPAPTGQQVAFGSGAGDILNAVFIGNAPTNADSKLGEDRTKAILARMRAILAQMRSGQGDQKKLMAEYYQLMKSPEIALQRERAESDFKDYMGPTLKILGAYFLSLRYGAKIVLGAAMGEAGSMAENKAWDAAMHTDK